MDLRVAVRADDVGDDRISGVFGEAHAAVGRIGEALRERDAAGELAAVARRRVEEQDRTRAGIETAQDRRDLSSAEKLRSQKKGQNAFCHIPDQYDQSRLRPEIPERIGRPGISRSDLSYVNAFCLAI